MGRDTLESDPARGSESDMLDSPLYEGGVAGWRFCLVESGVFDICSKMKRYRCAYIHNHSCNAGTSCMQSHGIYKAGMEV